MWANPGANCGVGPVSATNTPDKLIVEADGGSRGNPGPAGFGAIVKDARTGTILAERAEYLGIATNNVAEYRGLIAGLRAAAEINPTASVVARMDSKLFVEHKRTEGNTTDLRSREQSVLSLCV